ncbi:AsmA family protein [Kordiimonas marina]|uniref:DUF748 domain-containing protein n=1 Tax=Kordiimonas marina TaxID=2872312 RepID=UPI001FF4DFF9|nr:AsmA family protein [Kordiimonas marina]MCJ9428457.1 AsmA family protein [Kordiimonas marina]
MKKIILGLIVILLIVVGVGYSQLDGIVKKGIETGGPKALKVSVGVEKVNLSPFSGQVAVNGFNIGQPTGFGDGVMASVGGLDMKLEPKSLLTKHIIIDHIDVTAPLFDVRIDDKGKTNFKALQENLGPSKASDPSDITLTIRRLSVKAPKLSIHSKAMLKVDKDVSLADFTLTNIGTDEKGLAPWEIARHIMDTLQPQITKALVSAGFGDKIQNMLKDQRGGLESKLGDVLGKLKPKEEEKSDQPNN